MFTDQVAFKLFRFFGALPYSIKTTRCRKHRKLSKHVLFSRSRLCEIHNLLILMMATLGLAYFVCHRFAKSTPARKITLVAQCISTPLTMTSILLAAPSRREKFFALMEKSALFDCKFAKWGWISNRSSYVRYLALSQAWLLGWAFFDLFNGDEMWHLVSWIVVSTVSSFVLVYCTIVKAVQEKLDVVNDILRTLLEPMSSGTQHILPRHKRKLRLILEMLQSMHSDLCEIWGQLSECFAVSLVLVWVFCLMELTTSSYDLVQAFFIFSEIEFWSNVKSISVLVFWTRMLMTVSDVASATVNKVSGGCLQREEIWEC